MISCIEQLIYYFKYKNPKQQEEILVSNIQVEGWVNKLMIRVIEG